MTWINSGDRTVSSINVIQRSWCPHAEEWNWTPVSHHRQKSTQNILRLKCESKNCQTTRRKHRAKASRYWSGQWFFLAIPKAQALNTNRDKGDCFDLKTCAQQKK